MPVSSAHFRFAGNSCNLPPLPSTAARCRCWQGNCICLHSPCLSLPRCAFCSRAIVVVVSLPTFPLQTTGGRGCVTPPQAMGETDTQGYNRPWMRERQGSQMSRGGGKSKALKGRRRRRAWYVKRDTKERNATINWWKKCEKEGRKCEDNNAAKREVICKESWNQKEMQEVKETKEMTCRRSYAPLTFFSSDCSHAC